jgi:hypothetical protein
MPHLEASRSIERGMLAPHRREARPDSRRSAAMCHGPLAMNRTALAFAAAAALASPAAAEAPPAAESVEEARIPFLHIGRMRSFRAIDRHTLYIQARRREWYRVTTFGSCLNLPWAHVIGVDTHGSPVFDRTSVLIVDGERCTIRSVVRSGEPPSRSERRRRG